MNATASQITSLAIVYSSIYWDADLRKNPSSASLAFVRGIHRGPVNSPHKGAGTRKMFPFDDVIMTQTYGKVNQALYPWLHSYTIGWLFSLQGYAMLWLLCPHPQSTTHNTNCYIWDTPVITGNQPVKVYDGGVAPVHEPWFRCTDSCDMSSMCSTIELYSLGTGCGFIRA